MNKFIILHHFSIRNSNKEQVRNHASCLINIAHIKSVTAIERSTYFPWDNCCIMDMTNPNDYYYVEGDLQTWENHLNHE